MKIFFISKKNVRTINPVINILNAISLNGMNKIKPDKSMKYPIVFKIFGEIKKSGI